MMPGKPPCGGHPSDWYIATWRKTFEELLDSAEPALSRTIDRWRKYMADENDLFYNGTPISYAMSELIAREFPTLPVGLNGLELSRELEASIVSAVIGPEVDFPDSDPDYDWEAARQRVRQIFERWHREFS